MQNIVNEANSCKVELEDRRHAEKISFPASRKRSLEPEQPKRHPEEFDKQSLNQDENPQIMVRTWAL